MKNLPDLSFVNGKRTSVIPVSNRGLAYGDGLFETILCLDGKPVLFSNHLKRLYRDAIRIQMQIDRSALESELKMFIKELANDACTVGVMKVIITRKSSGRGYGFSSNIGSDRLLQFFAGVNYPKHNVEGIRISISDHRLSDNTALAGIKHLNRLDQVITQSMLRKPFYQETLVLGAHGEVIECSASNIFSVKNSVVHTPGLTKAGVQGVMRDYILDTVCPKLKLKCDIKPMTLDQLLSSDSVFVCNSVFGVWPVSAINVKQFDVNDITKTIQKSVHALGYSRLYG